MNAPSQAPAVPAEPVGLERDRILEVLGVGVYCVDGEGRCTFINQAALDLLGYSRAEVLGRNMHDLLHHTRPDGSPCAPDACAVVSALRSGQPLQLDCETLWRKDGSSFAAEYASFPIDERRPAAGCAVTLRDVSRRANAQRRLAVQIAVSRVLAGSADVGTAMTQVLEAIGSGLGWQAGAFWTVEQARDELRAMSVWATPSLAGDLFLPVTLQTRLQRGVGLPGRVWEADAPATIEDIASDSNFIRRETALKAGLRYGFGFPVKAQSQILGIIEVFGTERCHLDSDFCASIAALGDQIGQFVLRKRAEEELRESEALKAAIVDAALDCIITIDSASRIIEWNPAAERTFGYRKEGALGKSLAGLIIPPEYREKHYEGMRRYLQSGEGPVLGRRVEIEAMRADGTRIPIELAINVIELGGRPHFTASLRDLKDRKRGQADSS